MSNVCQRGKNFCIAAVPAKVGSGLSSWSWSSPPVADSPPRFMCRPGNSFNPPALPDLPDEFTLSLLINIFTAIVLILERDPTISL